MDDFNKQIQEVFKDYSTTTIKIFKDWKLFWIFLLTIFCIIYFCDEINSKHWQISRSVMNFQGKILIFKVVQLPLKRHFNFQHFSRSSRACTNPGNIFINCTQRKYTQWHQEKEKNKFCKLLSWDWERKREQKKEREGASYSNRENKNK